MKEQGRRRFDDEYPHVGAVGVEWDGEFGVWHVLATVRV